MGTITRTLANNLTTGLGISGKVVAVSTAKQTSSFETNNNSYTDVTGLSLDYTMQSSSNKILFTVHGSTQRGSQDGGTGSVLEFDSSEIPTDIQVMINNNEKGLALLRIAEVIGQDRLERIDDDTIYFIISTLNQLDIDLLRNRILLKVLPLKV